ncbi:hypothetical protein CT19431_MP30409 [Cupriavidus taiwanensis]|nr:hypothetical protein CT19431_MP30409 [Cupriavidus taiwanensis]
MTLRVFSPLPLAGEGPGERAGGGNCDGLHFVDIPALPPTLSRKREREYTIRCENNRVGRKSDGWLVDRLMFRFFVTC